MSALIQRCAAPVLALVLTGGCVVQPYGGSGYAAPPAGPTYHGPVPAEPIPVAPVPAEPIHDHHAHPAFFTPAAPFTGGGSIAIEHSDIGGGNWLEPKAKVNVRIGGARASQVTLYRITGAGAADELQSYSASNGAFITFNCRYSRLDTAGFLIVLYDGRGRILARVEPH